MLIRKNYFLYNVDKGGKELAGSARLTVQENTWKLELQWKGNGARLLESGDEVLLRHQDQEILLSSLPALQPPSGQTSQKPPQQPQQEVSQQPSGQTSQETLQQPQLLQSQMTQQESSSAVPQPYQKPQQQPPQQPQQWSQSQQPKTTPQSSTLQQPQPQPECDNLPQTSHLSYWEEIRAQCDRIEGCAELGEVYRIGKGDFALLPEQLRHMLQNSFLIHGLMNYGYLILCRTEREQETVSLGVPGVYYEKEKLVAEMFGFDRFWCREKSDNGKFGYYLRIVV